MAEVLLGPVVDATVSKVIAVASEQFNLAWGWKDDLKRFCRIMKMLQSVLQDADEKNVIGTNRQLKSWLMELKAVADEADDVMEEVGYENLRRQIANPKPKWKKVSKFFIPSKFNPLVFPVRMAYKVKNLNSNLADINDWAMRLGLQFKLATTVVEPMANPQETNSFLSIKPIGRENDVSELEKLLINEAGGQDLPVIAIVGMPGLGKTTLAKAVSKSPQICEKFGNFVLWVSVSKFFEPVWVLKGMLESIRKDAGLNVNSEESAIKELQKELGVKNYLLILDDVWNQERHKWEGLRSCLLGVSRSQGNRVLVTTRIKTVASVMTHTEKHIYSLQGLEKGDCWTIIKGRAFGVAELTPELEAVGDKISEKCNGVPLVASLIGATLQNRWEVREWQSILDNQAWHSLARENGILGIIKLSYDRLPELALKQCFAFCSIFPEDFVMEREMLIQLWMAEGFLQPSEECSVEMEDIGDKYFECLLSCSLFQEEGKDDLGRVTSCTMHDTIHEFAVSISKSETLISNDESENNVSSRIRHLNLIHGGGITPSISGDAALNLRTLMFSKHDTRSSVQSDLKRLRVLIVRDASDADQLSKCFGNSKSLRYLDISGTKLKEFPKFVKKLYNLQTVRFMNCEALQMPPGGFGNLINLRHIHFNDKDRMPANLGRLTNLQTLPLFYVGTTEGRRIEELGSLNRLKGRLEIHNLELVKGKSEAESAKLREKALDELWLGWSNEDGEDCGDVLEGLQPSSNLKRLDINGFTGEVLPSWMLSSGFHLNNLVILYLQYLNLKSVPIMGGFPSLQELYLHRLDEVTDAAFEFMSLKKLFVYGCGNLKTVSHIMLPALERLSFKSCRVVESIADGLSECRRLKSIVLQVCYNLKTLPNLHGLSSLESLSIDLNDELVDLPSGLSSCAALKVLNLWKCSKLVSVPQDLKRLCSLETLKIYDCRNLSRFPNDSLGFLSKLKTLWIGGFSNELEEFPGFSSIHHLPASLEELRLVGWGRLTRLPHQIQAFTALKELQIHDFHSVETLPDWLGNISSLMKLQIYECSGLRSLGTGLPSCTGVKELIIMNCNSLTSVPGEVKELSSLVHLSIVFCSNLRSFSEESLGGLTSLKTLGLGSFCEDLEEFIGLSSIHHLHASLEDLTLNGWEKLSELPQQIKQLTSLRRLSIYDFKGVEALPEWLRNLTSLQSLELISPDCQNLKLLPSMEVIKWLSKLNRLVIYPDWPELQEKIQQEKQSGAQTQ